jgi:hypothetical protein
VASRVFSLHYLNEGSSCRAYALGDLKAASETLVRHIAQATAEDESLSAGAAGLALATIGLPTLQKR